MNSETNSTNDNSKQNESKNSTVILFLSFSVLSTANSICGCRTFTWFYYWNYQTQIKNVNNDFLHGEIELSEIDPHLLYYIFLPLLIFDSSFNGHFHVIKQQLLSAILLAGPGVFISTAIIAIYIFPYDWSWLVGLMFGSILSATDPIAVVALLHDSGASKSLASLIDSESLLNDGSAFVMFLIFHNIITGDDNSAKSIIINIVKYSIGGPAFGLVCGIISVIVLNRINNELEVEITFTFGLAYLVFYVADVELGVSAVLTLVTMGLYMSKYKYCISSNVQPAMASAWRISTYFVNILIFTVTGIILARSFIGTATNITAQDFGFSIVLYVIMHIGIPTTLSSPLSNTTRLYHDKPSDGEYIEQNLEIGDLLLIASDGLFDNLYEDFIVQIINNHLGDQFSVESLQNVCQMLVQSACHARIKRDDILVLLFCVVPCSPMLSIGEINGSSKSASDSSLSSLLVSQDDEESLDLFIFKD